MFLRELNNDEKKAFYTLAGSIVNADENIAQNEEVLMRQYLQEMNMADNETGSCTVAEAVDILAKTNRETRRKVYIELFALGTCDNELASVERDLLNHYAGVLEIAEQDQNDLETCIMDLLQVYNRMSMLISR